MILYIDACIRGSQSRTRELCKFFLQKYACRNPHDIIETVRLADANFLPLNSTTVEQREKLIKEECWSDSMFQAARQFSRADNVLIGAPYWDFSFPAALKCYIENICVNGLTFRYTATSTHSLCHIKKMLFVSSIGGKPLNHNAGYGYCRELFTSFFGVSSCDYVKAEGLDIAGNNVSAILKQAKNKLLKIVDAF